ncbi:hypothetical protein [Haladaptatus sp. W1]|uniref:hypothetical protein n=1 Tax=Haladaptatus sp. W1 TaxID=1897478 RepID=UPI0020C765EE|nr:hypothetical protein [Haladaptatus sp. W1]
MKFGVISTVTIGTNVVVPAIREAGHEVSALASRDASRAASVADWLEVPRAYGTYDELLGDDEIEAVYNPLGHDVLSKSAMAWTFAPSKPVFSFRCVTPKTFDSIQTSLAEV